MRRWRFEVFGERTLRCWGPEGEPKRERPLAEGEVDGLIAEVEAANQRIRQSLTREEKEREQRRIGRRLYDWLDGAQERWLAKAREGGPGLTLEIDTAERLRHLPWELLHDGNVYLCAETNLRVTPLRRAANRNQPRDPAPRAIRVLFMACSPTDVTPVLDFEREEQVILEATLRPGIELVVDERGSLGGLEEQVELYGANHFDVLHLTGHADARDGKPVFAMEDDQGRVKPASAEEIVRALGGIWPRVVFLSGCFTAHSPDQGALPSLAEALITAGAPAVLGWSLPVGDVAATEAAGALYDALSHGRDLDEAVAEARASLFEQKSAYWGLLRLYTDGTPPGALVTPLRGRKKQPVRTRSAAQEFLDRKQGRGEVCPRKDFVGRRRELQRCLRVLRAVYGEDAYAEGVLIHGMGGLGKSSLAARLCDRLLDSHVRAVWVGALDETALLGVLAEAAPDAVEALSQPGWSLKVRLQQMLEGLAKPLLFVFDDFEQNVEKEADGTPKTDADGRAVLRPEPLDVLRAVMEAIRDSGTDSRVLLTCRYDLVPASRTARWETLALQHMSGADLVKKRRQLSALSPDSQVPVELRERALALGSGNPRLLQWLDLVLTDEGIDSGEILAALEGKAEEFRESVLLRALLAQQSDELRQVLARLAVLQLPAEREVLEVTVGELPLEPHLGRAVALGLVEAGPHFVDGSERLLVAPVVGPLLEGELDEEARREAAGRAAESWYARLARTEAKQSIAEGLEIHRLALLGRASGIAADVCFVLSSHWINISRYQEAANLCETTIAVSGDYRVMHQFARAIDALGQVDDAARYYEIALECCDEADEDIGARHRGMILFNSASLYAQRGETDEAMDRFRQAESLFDELGFSIGKAAILKEVGSTYLVQGRVAEALDAYNKAMELLKDSEDWHSIAVLKNSIGSIYAQRGDVSMALKCFESAWALFERHGDMSGMAITQYRIAENCMQQGSIHEAENRYILAHQAFCETGEIVGIAMALRGLASICICQRRFEDALVRCEDALTIYRKIRDVSGEASVLHELATIAAETGSIEKALQLFGDSIKCNERIKCIDGMSASYIQVAQIHFSQGRIDESCISFEIGLKLSVETGNLRIQAAALAGLASIAGKNGDESKQLHFNCEAAAALAKIQAWTSLHVVISNIASATDGDKARILSQAVSIGMRAFVHPTNALMIAIRLTKWLGFGSTLAYRTAAYAAMLQTLAGEQVSTGEMAGIGFRVLVACAGERGITTQEAFEAWVEREGLNDPHRLLPALSAELEALVPEAEWLFDRALLPELDVDRWLAENRASGEPMSQ